MAFDRAGALYIADSGNNAVRKLYADGTIGTVLGRNPGTTLYAPLAVAVDPAGTLYVGDSTFVVRAFTTAGKWIGYAGTGVPAFPGDGGSAANAALITVNDLAADVSGNLLIADGVRVRRVDPAGTIATVAGDGYVHSVGDGGPATLAQLFQPSALALDSAGNLFIADSGTERIRQVRNDGTMTTLAGNGNGGTGRRRRRPRRQRGAQHADGCGHGFRGQRAGGGHLQSPRAAGHPGARHPHGGGHRDGRRQSRGHSAARGTIARTARRVRRPRRQSCTSWIPATTGSCACRPADAADGRGQRVAGQRGRRRRGASRTVEYAQRLRHRFRRQPLYRRHGQPRHPQGKSGRE